MILYGVGVGPGDPDLVTIGARRIIQESDVVFIPVSSEDRRSIAGGIYSRLSGERRTYPMRFLMTEDSIVRDAEIRRQLVEMTDVWRGAQTIAMPVIGDSALYASIAYLYSVLRELCPGLELKLLPGVSAHSLSSSLAGEFLALGAERFSVLPGTAGFHKLAETMLASDCVAIYKPSALGKDLPRLVNSTGPWGRAVRVHRAGLPGELILSGEEAVAPTDEYLSILLLWRERK